MSSKKLETLAATLSPTQQKVLAQKKLEGSYTPSKLIKLMKKLVRYDQQNDSLRAALKKRQLFCFIGGFLLFFVSIFVSAILESFAPLTIALSMAAVFFLFGARAYSKSNRLKQKDLSNDWREFVFPFASLMKEEVLPQSKMNLSIDGRSPFEKVFFVEKVKKEKYIGRSYEHYRQPWLRGNLTFADHTRLFFESDKYVSKIKITKRGRSGKIKTKQKEKMKEVTLLKMVAPKNNYSLSGKQWSHISAQEAGDTIVIKGKFKYKAQGIRSLPINDFLNIIHQMYATLKPIT